MGYFLALAAIFFWSFNIIIASYYASSLLPFEIAFGRWLVASMILVPLAWGEIRKHWHWFYEHWMLLLSLAITGIALDNTLIYYSGRTASAINMGLLDVTGPIFLVILSKIFLKTPISSRQIGGLTIAVFGVLVIILQGDLTQLKNIQLVSGDFIMLLNSLCFAIYSLLQSKRPMQISQSAFLGATALTGVFVILPFLLMTMSVERFESLRWMDYGIFIYLGIFNSVLSYLAWNTALAKIGNIKTSIIYYLLPLFSGVEAYYLLQEKLYISQLVGGLLVIFGIMLVSLQKKKVKIS